MRLEATAVNMAEMGRRGTGLVQITIERWSTDQERDALRDALIEKGGNALLTALQAIKPRAGFINTPQSRSWNIQYARANVISTGGMRIVIATDRPMEFWEVRQNQRSEEYQFLLAEIHITPEGKGEGKLVPRAKVSFNKDQRAVEIENYAGQPVLLGDVRLRKD
jgi:hypothetical protein